MADDTRVGATLTRQDVLDLYRRLGIAPIGGGSGEDDPKPGDDEPKPGTEDPKPGEGDPKPGEEELGDAGKKALAAIRKEKADAEKRAIAAEKRLADIDAAKAKADEEAAAKKGEFQQLAEDRKVKLEDSHRTLKTVTEERDALAAKVQTYEDRDRAAIEAWVKDHKGQHPDLFEFDPGPDAPLTDRMTWFEKARKHAENRVTNPVNGTGAKPKVLDGKDPKADEEARNAQARQTANSF